MEPLSSLHLLAEAVRNAGADIAPTYQEYIQLAFAIATDCGEAGRHDFLSLCSLSSKFDRRAADKLFSNALKTGRNDVHLGTAFHLAEPPLVHLVHKVHPSLLPHTHAHARKSPHRALNHCLHYPLSTNTSTGLIP